VSDYIFSNLHRRINTDELAGLISLNPIYLSSLFKKNTGYSLRQYINRIKLNSAEDAMAYESLSVQDAAKKCGFDDVYYFSKIFKEIKGYPPSHVRKMILKDSSKQGLPAK